MEYLTLDYIKAHSRIDYDCEDDLIELYGSAAEQMVLNYLECSLDDLKEANGGMVPPVVINATYMIADNLYRHRSPTEQTSLYLVPYGIDLMLKPYKVL